MKKEDRKKRKATVYFDENIYIALKAWVVKEKTTMSEFVTEAVDSFIGELEALEQLPVIIRRHNEETFLKHKKKYELEIRELSLKALEIIISSASNEEEKLSTSELFKKRNIKSMSDLIIKANLVKDYTGFEKMLLEIFKKVSTEKG